MELGGGGLEIKVMIYLSVFKKKMNFYRTICSECLALFSLLVVCFMLFNKDKLNFFLTFRSSTADKAIESVSALQTTDKGLGLCFLSF